MKNHVLSQNPYLKEICTWSLQFDKPLTISQVSFEENCVDDHILMIGDTAGLIHPMCGNGMAMAIHMQKSHQTWWSVIEVENQKRVVGKRK
jgi:hypothetical protein